jgi:uncharacterized membrane protein YedE/YeeE
VIRSAAALFSGIVFGLGLAVSQMVNPAKVVAFLDVAGRWDPSLAFVMMGALAVTAGGFRLALNKPKPVLTEAFHLSTSRAVDQRLVAGAALFGIGWGLVGFCPGPAIASLAFPTAQSFVFVVAMVLGAALFHFSARMRSRADPASQQA